MEDEFNYDLDFDLYKLSSNEIPSKRNIHTPSTEVARNTSFGESTFDEKFFPNVEYNWDGQGDSIDELIQENRAQRQPWGYKFAAGLGRVGVKVAAEIAKLPGTAGGIVAGGIGQLKDLVTGKDETDFMKTAFDNAFINAIQDKEEEFKSEYLPVYVKEAVKNGNIWDNITSIDFWATEGADGLGYIASMLVPGALINKYNIGSKLLGVDKLTKMSRSSAKARLALMKTGYNSKNANLFTATMANTIVEAGAEAKGSMDSYEAELSRRFNLEEGDPDKLTAEQYEEELKLSSKVGANVFATNAAILIGPNMIMSKMLWGGPRNKAPNKITSKGGKLDYKELTLANKVNNFGQDFAKAGAREGFFEEGMQSTAETYFTENPDKTFLNFIGGDFAQAYLDTIATTEGQKAIVLGMAFGGGMQAVTGAIESSKENKAYNTLAQVGNSTLDEFYNLLQDDIYVKNEEGNIEYEVNEEGKSVAKIDNKKASDKLLSYMKAQNISDAYDLALARGDNKTVKDLQDVMTTHLVKPFIFNESLGLDVLRAHLEESTKLEDLPQEVVDNKDEFIKTVMKKAAYLQKQHGLVKDFAEDMYDLSETELNDDHKVSFINNKINQYVNLKAQEYYYSNKDSQIDAELDNLLDSKGIDKGIYSENGRHQIELTTTDKRFAINNNNKKQVTSALENISDKLDTFFSEENVTKDVANADKEYKKSVELAKKDKEVEDVLDKIKKATTQEELDEIQSPFEEANIKVGEVKSKRRNELLELETAKDKEVAESNEAFDEGEKANSTKPEKDDKHAVYNTEGNPNTTYTEEENENTVSGIIPETNKGDTSSQKEAIDKIEAERRDEIKNRNREDTNITANELSRALQQTLLKDELHEALALKAQEIPKGSITKDTHPKLYQELLDLGVKPFKNNISTIEVYEKQKERELELKKEQAESVKELGLKRITEEKRKVLDKEKFDKINAKYDAKLSKLNNVYESVSQPRIVITDNNKGSVKKAHPNVSDEAVEMERNPVNKIGDSKNLEINRDYKGSENINKALAMFDKKDTSDMDFLYKYLPLNVKLDDYVSANLETYPTTPDSQAIFNETSLPLRTTIIKELMFNNASIDDIKIEIGGQQNGELQLDGENNNFIHELYDFDGDLSKVTSNELYVVNDKRRLVNVNNNRLIVGRKLGRGEVYLSINTAAGNKFPLKLNIGRLNAEQADTLYDIYKYRFTNREEGKNGLIKDLPTELQEKIKLHLKREVDLYAKNNKAYDELTVKDMIDLLIWDGTSNKKTEIRFYKDKLIIANKKYTEDEFNSPEGKKEVLHFLTDIKRRNVKFKRNRTAGETADSLNMENKSYIDYLLTNKILSTNAKVGGHTFAGKTTMYLSKDTVKVNDILSEYNKDVQPVYKSNLLGSNKMLKKKLPNMTSNPVELTASQEFYEDKFGKEYDRVSTLKDGTPNLDKLNVYNAAKRGDVIDELLRLFFTKNITEADFIKLGKKQLDKVNKSKNKTTVKMADSFYKQLYDILYVYKKEFNNRGYTIYANSPTLKGKLGVNGKNAGRYAGTMDLLAYDNNNKKWIIIDLKTSTIDRNLYYTGELEDNNEYVEKDRIQQNAYKELFKQTNGIAEVELLILPLTATSDTELNDMYSDIRLSSTNKFIEVNTEKSIYDLVKIKMQFKNNKDVVDNLMSGKEMPSETEDSNDSSANIGNVDDFLAKMGAEIPGAKKAAVSKKTPKKGTKKDTKPEIPKPIVNKNIIPTTDTDYFQIVSDIENTESFEMEIGDNVYLFSYNTNLILDATTNQIVNNLKLGLSIIDKWNVDNPSGSNYHLDKKTIEKVWKSKINSVPLQESSKLIKNEGTVTDVIDFSLITESVANKAIIKLMKSNRKNIKNINKVASKGSTNVEKLELIINYLVDKGDSVNSLIKKCGL